MRPKTSTEARGMPRDADQSKESQTIETMQRKYLRLVLIGKTGSGRSACGNTILGRRNFESHLSGSSLTKTCTVGTVELAGEEKKRVVVVDTPGFGDTHLGEDEVHTEIAKCVALSAPGPHAFLLVVPLGRYTENEDRAVDQLTQIFGEEALRLHTLVLFTRGDELKGGAVEDFLQTAPPRLHALIERCGGRYHVFNNNDQGRVRDSVQVKELISKVDKMATQTATGFYTSKLYEGAVAAIREEQEGQLSRQRQPGGEDQGYSSCSSESSSSSSSSRERRAQPGSSGGANSECNWQSWLDAALSPKVLKIIRNMVAAVAAGAAVGAVVGLAVPVAATCGAGLVGNSVGAAAGLLAGEAAGTAVGAVVTAATSTAALGVGAAAGAVVGGAVGAVAATEADSPSEAAQNAVKQVAEVGVAAVGVAAVAVSVLGAGVAVHAASGVAAGAAKAAAQSDAAAGAANAAAQGGAAAVTQSATDAPGTRGTATLLPAAAAAGGVLCGGGGGSPTFKYQKVKKTSGDGPAPSTTEETLLEISWKK